MLSDLDPNSSAWTMITLIALFVLIPVILFTLGRAAAGGGQSEEGKGTERPKDLATILDVSANELLAEATRSLVKTERERKALESLIRLSEGADAFQKLLSGSSTSATRARRALQGLTVDFERARDELSTLRSGGAGAERLLEIQKAIDELRGHYHETRSAHPVKSVVADDSESRGRRAGPNG